MLSHRLLRLIPAVRRQAREGLVPGVRAGKEDRVVQVRRHRIAGRAPKRKEGKEGPVGHHNRPDRSGSVC